MAKVTIGAIEFAAEFRFREGVDFLMTVDLIEATPLATPHKLHFRLVVDPETIFHVAYGKTDPQAKAEQLYHTLVDALTGKTTYEAKFCSSLSGGAPQDAPAQCQIDLPTDVLVLALPLPLSAPLWLVFDQVHEEDSQLSGVQLQSQLTQRAAGLSRQLAPLQEKVDRQMHLAQDVQAKLEEMGPIAPRQSPAFAVLAQANWANGKQICNWQPFNQAACPATAGLIRLEANKVIFPQVGIYRIRLQGGLDVSGAQWSVSFQLNGTAVMTRTGYSSQTRTVDWGMEGIFQVGANDSFQLEYLTNYAGNYVPAGQNLLWIEKMA
ncbi:hypothetical protein PAPYR_8649 [Paratrimastix pyriformis]|uniref:Uncharacterized protein n=1 Tax=Paratrimastix pyriformis TaxID=342808 RepID=A0ABQ8UA66_9EUKA|nr:hypothetical protein PAPYR_8649 [Paratrimastix pyriformis]